MFKAIDRVNRTDREGKETMHQELERRKKQPGRPLTFLLDEEEMEQHPWQKLDEDLVRESEKGETGMKDECPKRQASKRRRSPLSSYVRKPRRKP